MKKDQVEVLNVMQQVLKHVLLSITATDPSKTALLGTILYAAATDRRLAAQSRVMLHDLAEGINVLSSVGQPKQ